MKNIELEIKRVAVAFEVSRFRINRWCINMFQFNGYSGEDYIVWSFLKETEQLVYIRFGKESERCVVHRFSQSIVLDHWRCVPHFRFNEKMARGLYRLGFDDEGVLAKLNHPLTAHEQLELRNSMSPEFWPQRWLGETHG
jgi:hypothetical protein